MNKSIFVLSLFLLLLLQIVQANLETNCFGVSASNPKVCGGKTRGVCLAENTCICKPGYHGEQCEIQVCAHLHSFLKNLEITKKEDMDWSVLLPKESGHPTVSEEQLNSKATFEDLLKNRKGCTKANPAKNCKEIFFLQHITSPTGLYWIQTSTDQSMLIYCDMNREKLGTDEHSLTVDLDLQLFESLTPNATTPATQPSSVFPTTTTTTTSNITVNLSQVKLNIPKLWLKYNLEPKAISKSKIVFYNAKDLQFYERKLKNPSLIVWLLTSGNRYGGKSLNYSSKRLFETAYKMNIQLEILITSKFDLIASQEDGLEYIYYDGKKISKLPDVVLPRLGAKIDYFGLSVVRQFEKMGIPVLNTHDSLEMSKDKLYTIQQLAAKHFPIPKTMIVKFPFNYTTVGEEFGFPFIMKKVSGTHGKSVILVKNKEHFSELEPLVDQTKPMIIQKFIKASSGKDIRVIVVGGKAVGGMMRVAKSGFKSNFHQGGFVKPIQISPALEWLATESAKMLNLDIAGVDVLLDKNTYRICEINASPGYTGFELATGIDVPAKILEYAITRVRNYQWQGKKKKKIVEIPIDVQYYTPARVPSTGSSSSKVTTDQKS